MKTSFLAPAAALGAFVYLLAGCGQPANYHDPRNNPADCPATTPGVSVTSVACSTSSTCWYDDRCNRPCTCQAGDGGSTWFCGVCE